MTASPTTKHWSYVSGTLVNAGYALAGGWVSEKLRREPRWRNGAERAQIETRLRKLEVSGAEYPGKGE